MEPPVAPAHRTRHPYTPSGGRASVLGAWVMLAALAAGSPAAAREPALRVQATRVLLPLVTADALDAGQISSDAARGAYAVELEVEDGDGSSGWAVYIRADGSSFQPETTGKPASHLRWKLDHEDERSFRPLDEHETILLANPGGGDARILLDLSVALGWDTDPGTYGLGILLRVARL